MTEEELMREEELMAQLQRTEDASGDVERAAETKFNQAQRDKLVMAEQARVEKILAEKAFRQAAEAGNRGSLLAAPRPAMPSVRKVAPAPVVSQKAEEKSFKAQANEIARVGDRGGQGAKLKPKPPTAAEGPASISIKKGDTLWAMSMKYGVPVEKLRELNSNVDPKLLQIGSELRLREPDPTPVEETGQSPLAKRLSAMRNGSQNRSFLDLMGELKDNFHNNPDNTATLDTMGNYLNAAAGAGGVTLVPKAAGLLAAARNSRAGQAVAKALPNSQEMVRRLFPDPRLMRPNRPYE